MQCMIEFSDNVKHLVDDFSTVAERVVDEFVYAGLHAIDGRQKMKVSASFCLAGPPHPR